MRRFGGREAFLELLERVRARAPLAGVRTNVIVGFPGETEADVAELEASSSRPGSTSSACSATPTRTAPRPRPTTTSCPTTSSPSASRDIGSLVEELNLQRAEERIGESRRGAGRGASTHEDGVLEVSGRAAHQGPDVDGVTLLQVARRRAGAARR